MVVSCGVQLWVDKIAGLISGPQLHVPQLMQQNHHNHPNRVPALLLDDDMVPLLVEESLKPSNVRAVLGSVLSWFEEGKGRRGIVCYMNAERSKRIN